MKKLFFSLSALVIIMGCSKEKYHPMNSNEGNEVVEVSLYQESGVETVERYVRSTGNSTHLLLGQVDDQYNSRLLLRFTSLPSSATDILTAKLILIGRDALGDTSAPAFEAKLYEYDRDWDESDTTTWDEVAATPSQLIASALVYPETGDSIIFEIDKQLIFQWMDTSLADMNYGVWIESEGAEFMKDLYSNEISDEDFAPILHIEYTDTDTAATDTTTYISYPADDMFIIEEHVDGKLDDDLLYIGSGISFRSKLYFNLDSLIAMKASVNKATLRLVMNRDYSIFAGEGIGNLVATDSTFLFNGTTSVSEDTALINVTDIIRYWTYTGDPFPNYYILLRSSTEYSTIDRVGLYSSRADSTIAPRLDVVYSVPPSL